MGGLEKTTGGVEPKDTKSVTLVSAYEPITVHDQYFNPYICLNHYEAMRVRELILKLQSDGLTQYDTGDWWLDLPPKILKWGNDLAASIFEPPQSVSNPPKESL